MQLRKYVSELRQIFDKQEGVTAATSRRYGRLMFLLILRGVQVWVGSATAETR